MFQNIRLLSDLSYTIGLIGLSEYIERSQIVDWLEDEEELLTDPRLISDEKFEDAKREPPLEERNLDEKNDLLNKDSSIEDEPPWLKLLLLNKWMFTIGDRDCYPSVPHGHLYKKTNKWPKINPYTGRAFSNMHNEEQSHRLSKLEMKKLWGNPNFVEHCRKQVLWYSDFAPEYDFPRARFGKFIFPVWK
jgi:hypothetical protein